MTIVFDPALPFLTVDPDVNVGCGGIKGILDKFRHDLR